MDKVSDIQVTNGFSRSNDMIASRRTIELLCATTCMVAFTIFRVGPSMAAENQAARPAVRGVVQQVGHHDTYGAGCGPVCDHSGCGAEPVCGIDLGCGLETLAGCDGCERGCSECQESSCGIEEIYVDDANCGLETLSDCACDACSTRAKEQFLLPMVRFKWCEYEFFAGTQGFTGPMNYVSTNQANGSVRSGSGSFGFYEGFNHSKSLRKFGGLDLAAQFGVRAAQSNLSGGGFTNETRNQVFVTGGLFRRVDYGFQYGLVFDYMSQDWYFQGDSIQLRGELSWRTEACNTFGFQFMAGLRDETSTTILNDGSGGTQAGTIAFTPTDQYRLFFRRPISKYGEGNLFAGWTDSDDGLLGGGVAIPLSRHCALNTGVTYLIPAEGSTSGGNEQEVWSISMGLIFRPGGPQGSGRYTRPLFDVADNGTFMLDTK